MVVEEPQRSEAGQVGQRTLACRHVMKEGVIAGGYGVLRCLADADESGLCPVHRHEIALPRPSPHTRRQRRSK